MPTSQHYQISKIMQLVITLNPNSILDIGVGFGKYGVLCREYLELMDGREDYHNFKRRIDGIEAFEDYLTPLHEFVYDNIYKGNALNVVEQLDTDYDLVLLIDVLEHFSKSDGKKLIDKLLKSHRGILISIPKYIGFQKDSFCNPYETHKGQWSKKELKKISNSVFIKDNSSFILYLGTKNSVENIKSANKKMKMDIFITNIKRFIGSFPFVKSCYNAIKK